MPNRNDPKPLHEAVADLIASDPLYSVMDDAELSIALCNTLLHLHPADLTTQMAATYVIMSRFLPSIAQGSARDQDITPTLDELLDAIRNIGTILTADVITHFAADADLQPKNTPSPSIAQNAPAPKRTQ